MTVITAKTFPQNTEGPRLIEFDDVGRAGHPAVLFESGSFCRSPDEARDFNDGTSDRPGEREPRASTHSAQLPQFGFFASLQPP
jgi:hypothetical protein